VAEVKVLRRGFGSPGSCRKPASQIIFSDRRDLTRNVPTTIKAHKFLPNILKENPTTRTTTTNSNKNNNMLSEDQSITHGGMMAHALPSSPITIKATAPRQSRTTWEHSPVIIAMLTGNTMNSCEDAMKLHTECLKSNSGDMICQAAARQLCLCMEAEEQNSLRHVGA
jgi:hypothetical protein